eukprot:6125942-Amphidinium_carterae.1
MLPHEVLAALLQKSSIEALECIEGLDDTTLQHCMAVSTELGHQVVPLSFWQDGVPFNWDRSESLEVYSWSPPGQTRKGRAYRFPLVVFPHHLASKATHTAVMQVLQWSLTALAAGTWPSSGPNGAAYRHPHKGKVLAGKFR